MPNKLAHFAIAADDVDRARKFYESVFNWRFEPWGPPEFYLIHDAGVHGALQKRTQQPGPGQRGFECSIAVSNLSETSRLISENGGNTVGEVHAIPTVGELIRFVDTEGNEAIVVQYEPLAAAELRL